MHAVPDLYSSLVFVLIIAIWKPLIKYDDLGSLAAFVTLKPSILSKELMNFKSEVHSSPDPTGNISYKVTGGREIKFQSWTWLTGESMEEKGIWSDGEFGEEEDNSSKFLCDIRYYKVIYEKFNTWYSWESYLVYFPEVTLVNRVQ